MKVKPGSHQGDVIVEVHRKDDQLLEQSAKSETSLFKLKKILVPVDFSECSKKAIRYALPFARQFGASITLVHVIQIYYGGGEFGLIDVPVLEEQMREASVNQLNALRSSEIESEIQVEPIVLAGHPVNEITRLAKEKDIDLIIISTHGHTGLRHVFMGSTAENVVRHAPCPVLTVREHEHDFVE